MASQLMYPFFLFLLSATKARARAHQSNITIGSALYTNTTPTFWPSPSALFAFGFYPSGDGFKIGIWLVGVPNTIVWTAQRNDTPVPAGTALILSFDGRLVLQRANGQVQQVVNAHRQISYASMLDSGNFVLYDSSFKTVWASFDHPTDTLLAGQRLVSETYLISSLSGTDPSFGRFRLLMRSNGYLVAYPFTCFLYDNGRYDYWWAGYDNGESNASLNLNEDGRLYIQNTSRFSMTNLTVGGFPVNGTIVYRATFDVDGVLRLYMHQIEHNSSLTSTIMWSAISQEDRCTVKGNCGLNSYCTMDGANLTCLCPPGFDFIDRSQTYLGCKLNFSPEEDCLAHKVGMNYNMSTLEDTAFEFDEYALLYPATEEDCQRACLEDCNCVAALLKNGVCQSQKLPLRYGKTNVTTTKVFFKVRIGSSSRNPSTEANVVTKIVTKKLGKEVLTINLALVTFSLIVFVFSGYLIFRHRRGNYEMISTHAGPSDFVEDINLRSFNYDELVRATNNFKEEVGRGAFGRVYKGSLSNMGGREIAVKKLDKVVEEGEREFRTEMNVIGRTHHRNLVRLLGFCSEGLNRLLVYEYMRNGSLADLIFKAERRPNWKERVRISLEIARGILYLHEECKTRIIHCDIKPHNILMDEAWTAKISDFGLAKLLMPDQTRTNTSPRGTRGYQAPEWHKNELITVKADVYSFGILLFEIIFCRRKVEYSVPDEQVILLDWVCSCYDAGKLGKLVGDENMEAAELERMVKVGLWCVHTEQALRPSIKTVLLMLEGTVNTPPPPSPVSSVNG